MLPVAPRIAEWALGLRYDDLPGDVIETAKKCLLDHIACLLIGTTLEHVQPVKRHVLDLGGHPEATIARHPHKTAAIYAAYVNGTMAHGCEFDDCHALCSHPGVCVIPAALALCERDGRSGTDLILAMVAGYQAMVLSGAAIHKSCRRLGWHSMKIQGVFGAAATAGKLIGLDQAQLVNAFGIAGSEASGPLEYDQSGGEVKRLHAGSAVRSGMQAALLAQHGLTGPATIFEGKRGIYALFGDGFDADPESFWATEFHMRDTMFKLTPAVFTVHGAIQAAHILRARHAIDHRQIVRIDAEVAEVTLLHGAGIVEPGDVVGAQFSLAFSLGLAFARGTNRLADYLDRTAWADPDIVRIARLVRPAVVPVAPGASELGGRVRLVLADGRVLVHDQPVPHGHHHNPASFEALFDKFLALTDGILTSGDQARLAELIASVDRLPNVRALVQLIDGSRRTTH